MICSWIKKLINKKPEPTQEDKEIRAAIDEADKVFEDAEKEYIDAFKKVEKECANVFSEYDELDKILDETNRSE